MTDIENEFPIDPTLNENGFQHRLRGCVIESLNGLEDQDLVAVTRDLIVYLQRVVVPGLGVIRRKAAKKAVLSMGGVGKLAEHTGDSQQAVLRLVTEANRNQRVADGEL